MTACISRALGTPSVTTENQRPPSHQPRPLTTPDGAEPRSVSIAIFAPRLNEVIAAMSHLPVKISLRHKSLKVNHADKNEKVIVQPIYSTAPKVNSGPPAP